MHPPFRAAKVAISLHNVKSFSVAAGTTAIDQRAVAGRAKIR